MDELKAMLEKNSLELDQIKAEKKEKAAAHKKVDDENKTKLKKVKELNKQITNMGK